MTTDPFAHHPNLREKIKPPLSSSWRQFTAAYVLQMLDARGLPPIPVHDDETREALRRDTLRGHEGDLWVFAYGSLIWDPALDFVEVRRGFAPHHKRRFILKDIYGGRGTVEAPGLMAALDVGDGCHGLCFRVGAEHVEGETEILFRREALAPGYIPTFIPVQIDQGEVRALTFLADHNDTLTDPDITRDEQVRFAATGRGFLGTSHDYLRNVVDHLHEMAIPDPDLDALLAEVEAEMARIAAKGS